MGGTAYVNCWRAGQTKSMAMWDLYGKGGVVVAVKTTVGRLKEALSASPLRIFLAEATYVDWSLAPFDNNSLVMCFRKDSSYAHEREVRAVIWDVDVIGHSMSDALVAARTRPDYPNPGVDPFLVEKTVGRPGIEVPFDSARCLIEVVIGPRETHVIAGLVESILNRYGLKTKVTVSDRLKSRL